MASFFQPGLVVFGVANNTKYLIYGNSVLSSEDLRSHWYLAFIGGVALVAWAVISAVLYHRRNKAAQEVNFKPKVKHKHIFSEIFRKPCWRGRILGRDARAGLVPEVDGSANEVLVEGKLSAQGSSAVNNSADLELAKSYGFCSSSQLESRTPAPFDLCFIDLRAVKRFPESEATHLFAVEDVMKTECGQLHFTSEKPTHKTYAVFDFSDTWRSPLEISVDATSNLLQVIKQARRFDGLTLFIDSSLQSDHVNALLQHLCRQSISLLIASEPDNETLHQLNFELMSGVIFVNASIMRDGSRRSFFQMENLRKCLGRCARQRKTRKGFFIGFLELWDVQPSAAVVRRAYKLAEFFGALIQTGQRAPADESQLTDANKQLCLSAFDFLKTPEVVELQRAWNEQKKPIFYKQNEGMRPSLLDVEKLCSVLPSAAQKLRLYPLPESLHGLDGEKCESISPPPYTENAPARFEFWERSTAGNPFSVMGCFGILEEAFQVHFESIVTTQRRLRSLELLNPLSETETANFCEKLRVLEEKSLHASLIHDLIEALQLDTVRIYKGLDSGFKLPDNGGHFFGVSAEVYEDKNPRTTIYVSQKSSNTLATIVHTYLAHRGVTRRERFEEELNLAQLSDASAELPLSIREELNNATAAELLFLLEQVTVSGTDHHVATAMKKFATFLLIEQDTREAWKAVHSRHCLDGPRTVEELLAQRLRYFAQKGVKEVPSLSDLATLSKLLEQKMVEALFRGDRSSLETLLSVVSEPYNAQNGLEYVEPTVDLFCLIFFCALRKLAFENVYIETTDRCPFYLSQPDQAGVFAELWVLGSQCEIYFGIYPRTLGEVIYNKHQRYLLERPPPVDAWNAKDVFTAFSDLSPGVRLEGDFGPPSSGMGSGGSGPLRVASADELQGSKSFRQKLAQATSLAVFCVPAIIDICLLTFLGRGLYLTAFMPAEFLLMANYALLTSLLIAAGVTGFVGSVGGFYLYSFAFDNLAFFMVERLCGGFVITITVAVLGFLALSFEYSPLAAFVFAAYLISLTTFINILGVMATMNREGAPLSSGRTALAQCMTILFISPILSTFVNNHDILIYLLVIYTFVIVLIIRFQRLCQEWISFTSKVPTIKEKDILDWYKERKKVTVNTFTASEAREALIIEVDLARVGMISWSSLFKRTPIRDPFVHKLAVGYDISMWLLRKESNGEELPPRLSSTWLIQLGLTLANQKQLIKGLKQHSPFISFRYAKYDLAQNVGLFLIALLDHWVAIIMSARSPEPLIYFDARSRYGVAFGLIYFLISAIGVDVVLQRYWASVTAVSTEKLSSLVHFWNVVGNNNKLRKERYVNAVCELLMIMLPAFGICTILVWLLVDDLRSIIIFFLYILAYTGVIIFQFNRCFTTDPRSHVITVFCAAAVGFLVGICLRSVSITADWFYNYPIALTTASLSAVLGTWILIWGRQESKVTERVEKVVTSSRSSSFSAESMEDAQSDVDDNSMYKTESKKLKHISPSSHSGRVSTEAYKETNARLLDGLCLGVDVKLNWQRLPEDVRKAITYRILGVSFKLTTQLKDWLREQTLSLSNCDHMMHSCLEEFAMWRSTSLTEIHLPGNSEILTAEEVPELDFELAITQPSPNVINYCQHAVVKFFATGTKWIAIISGAAPDTGRELWYALRNSKFRKPVLWMCLKIWKVCWFLKNLALQVFLLKGKKQISPILKLVNQGVARKLTADVIEVDLVRKKAVGFVSWDEQGRLVLQIHDGVTTASFDAKPTALALYDHQYRLTTYQTNKTQAALIESTSIYSYSIAAPTDYRWPALKTVHDKSGSKTCIYDKYGRVISGTISRLEKTFKFSYTYRKRPRGNGEMLRATYQSTHADLPVAFTTEWCITPKDAKKIDDLIPSEKITRFVRTVGGVCWDTRWVYHHKRDPVLRTTLIEAGDTRILSQTPAEAVKDDYGFQEKPQNLSFDSEDFLIYHSTHAMQQMLGPRSTSSRNTWSTLRSCVRRIERLMPEQFSVASKTVYRHVATSELRTILWTAWTKSSDFDAMSACFLDELILRKELLLHPYWSLRDSGHFKDALEYLDENLEQIVCSIEPSNDASQSCPLIIKTADLFTMGLGKDANQITARPDGCYSDTHNRTSVLFSDNGCWPDAPGGVSNCRRDVVDGHKTIRNHALAESANDYGIPRYQIERNVNSVKVLPLWGLDGKTPYHGVFDNLLQTQVDEKMANTRIKEDVVGVFIPLLKRFVHGARSKLLRRETIVECSNVVLQMHRYFELRDYNTTWNSKEVAEAWIEAWLSPYDDPNITDPSEYFQLDKPSMSDFRDVLNLYICYFFIYSVPVPEDCPAVFQSTHHGVSSLFGMVLKIRKGTAWGIWDHAILWRETCLNVSPAQCLLPIPVQSMLLAGIRLACHMAYTHADVILPCTSVFNPDWERDLGTEQGLRGSRNLFSRKIDPIVNGIGNMDAFKVVEKTTSEKPTTIMLSNVQFIKDVKNAVLAADVIVNQFGFTDYRLKVYGAQDRQPSYCLETETIITKRKLTENVTLAGFGKPAQVLQEAWLFMNSSLSEGLPLAIGEAALAGVPIVATEVGATALVLTDADDPSILYGEVVPPNDSYSLARAQLSLLAMLGPWTKYCSDFDGTPIRLPVTFTPENRKWIMQRMYDKTPDRRRLGLKLREVVLRNFHGSRYLREHEQMYWIQRSMAEHRRAQRLANPKIARKVASFVEDPTFTFNWKEATDRKPKKPWRLFEDEEDEGQRRSSVLGNLRKLTHGISTGYSSGSTEQPDVEMVEVGKGKKDGVQEGSNRS